MGGRGAGKTRAGAEWLHALARNGHVSRVALIGPTFQDVREVMIEGASGIRALPDTGPAYEPSRRRLIWPNGAQGYAFSAEDPESLRGPQFDAVWADELCVWPHAEETLAILSHGLRLGDAPRLVVTTTPRPIPALKKLLGAPDTALTRSGTKENAANLSPGFIAALEARWTGSARDRQELLGELVEDLEGALWTRAALEALRTQVRMECETIVVAIDPPVSIGENADACGVVAAGASGEGSNRRAIVLADASAQGLAPLAWASPAVELARSLEADAIVAEANNGGELVREVLRVAAPEMPVRLVRAAIGKRARAEPIAALYAQGCVTHAAAFPALEDEMCGFGAPGFTKSPDRLDALVWALTELMFGGAAPRVRAL